MPKVKELGKQKKVEGKKLKPDILEKVMRKYLFFEMTAILVGRPFCST